MRTQLPIRVLKSVPVVPKINTTPSHGLFSFIKLSVVLKTHLAMQAGCPAASCPAMSCRKASVLPVLLCCHELNSLGFG